MKEKIIILLLITFSTNACSQNKNNNCDDIKYGTFELYEKGSIIGTIYRKGNYQIEKYLDRPEYTIVKLKSKKCLYYYNSYEINQDLDTLTWSVQYKNIKRNHYSFIGKPTYLTSLNYSYSGKLVKISKKIDKKILDVFDTIK